MSRYGWIAGVLLLACGCATEHGAKVSDAQLARVPADQLQQVNTARSEVARANDEIARRQLDLHNAQNDVNLAKQEVDIAQKQVKKSQTQHKNADYARNSNVADVANNELKVYNAKLATAQSHDQSARAEEAFQQARTQEAQANKSLKDAQLELAKYQALNASGDPAVKEVSQGHIQTRIEKAQQALNDAQAQVAQKRGVAEQRHEAWRNSYQQFQQVQGVGGSGSQLEAPDQHPTNQSIVPKPADQQEKAQQPNPDLQPPSPIDSSLPDTAAPGAPVTPERTP